MSKLKLSAFADEAAPDIVGQIKALNENGVPYIEVRGIGGQNISGITLEQAKEYTKIYNDGGVSVWSIGSPIGKVNINDDFTTELDRFKHCIEVGNIMGAECIRLFSFYGTEGKPEYKDAVCERLARFVEAAKGSGITLCHENEKGIYGELAPQCLEILKAVPEIKCIFDCANFIQAGQNTDEGWKLLRTYVKYFHVKDALADGRVVPPGYGLANLEAYIADYASMGGTVLSVEPHLSQFVGLGELSAEDAEKNVGAFKFASNREAFDFAVTQTKKIAKL